MISDEVLDYYKDALLPIFDVVHPALGEPLEEFTYTPPLQSGLSSLTIIVPPESREAGIHLFAHYVWNASLLVSDMISTGYWREFVEDKDVLELGAGAGLPSIICALKGASKVVVTDYPSQELIKNLEKNVNSALKDDKYRYVKDRIKVIGHSWGSTDQTSLEVLYRNKFDTILLADTVWEPESHFGLISSLKRSLYGGKEEEEEGEEGEEGKNKVVVDQERAKNARVLVVVGFHTGRSNVELFFNRAKEAGFSIVGETNGLEREQRLEEQIDERQKRQGNFGRVEIHKIGTMRDWQGHSNMNDYDEKRRWLVVAQLGWRKHM